MTNVLVYVESWGKGGIESFLMNTFRDTYSKEINYTLFSTWDWSTAYDNELNQMKISRKTVFHGRKPGQIKRLLKGISGFSALLTGKQYDAVWINTMNGLGFLYAWVAKRKKIPVRIVHSHNSDVGEGARHVKRFAGDIGKVIWGGAATARVACSIAAGEYLFNKRPFKVIRNGIDVDKFKFSEEKRAIIRNKLGIHKEDILVGSIGRLCYQKNTLLLIKIFASYKEINKSAKCLLVGRDELDGQVQKCADQLGLSDQVFFIESVDDPSPYYCALDAMLMPSQYEGLPFSLIEAQCASVPMLISDTIPKDGDITDLVKRCSLGDSPAIWAKCLDNQLRKFGSKRSLKYADLVKQRGYSSKEASEAIKELLE